MGSPSYDSGNREPGRNAHQPIVKGVGIQHCLHKIFPFHGTGFQIGGQIRQKTFGHICIHIAISQVYNIRTVAAGDGIVHRRHGILILVFRPFSSVIIVRNNSHFICIVLLVKVDHSFLYILVGIHGCQSDNLLLRYFGGFLLGKEGNLLAVVTIAPILRVNCDPAILQRLDHLDITAVDIAVRPNQNFLGGSRLQVILPEFGAIVDQKSSFRCRG